MKYMYLIYGEENCYTAEEREECMVTSMGICDELASQGKYIAASPLEYAETATTVRVRNGRTLVTAGPFAETVEQLGGFYLLDLDDLDEAISIASRLPPAKKGTVEIRPVFELEGLPPSDFTKVIEHDPELRPYLLICYDDEAYWEKEGEAALRAAMDRAVTLTKELASQGRFISAAPLHPSSTATSVRVRNHHRTITDGPFAETREVLGGFYLVLAKSKEELIEFVARHPGIEVGSLEIRPLFDTTAIRQAVSPSHAVA